MLPWLASWTLSACEWRRILALYTLRDARFGFLYYHPITVVGFPFLARLIVYVCLEEGLHGWWLSEQFTTPTVGRGQVQIKAVVIPPSTKIGMYACVGSINWYPGLSGSHKSINAWLWFGSLNEVQMGFYLSTHIVGHMHALSLNIIQESGVHLEKCFWGEVGV